MSGIRWRATLRDRQAETRARLAARKVAAKLERRPIAVRRPATVRETLTTKTKPARGGCLLWTGAVDRDGYGRLQVNGRKVRVHRLAWILERGAIPGDVVVRHSCNVPRCCAIAHLALGSQADNLRDRDEQGRGRVPVRNGGRWTGAHRPAPSAERKRGGKRAEPPLSEAKGARRNVLIHNGNSI